MNSYQIILFGFGRMGQTYAKALAMMGLEISCIVDPFYSKANSLIPHVDIKSEIDIPKPQPDTLEVVIIATTSNAKASIVEAILIRKPHLIILEKPMALSISEAVEISNKCQVNGIKLCINHPMRHMEIYREITRVQKEFNLGKLSSMIVNGSNFGLAMNGTHYIEAFRLVSGSNLEWVQGWIDETPQISGRGPDLPDYSGKILGENADGVGFFLDASADSGHGIITVYNFQFGKIIVDELLGLLEVIARTDTSLEKPTSAYGGDSLKKSWKITSPTLEEITRRSLQAAIFGQEFPSSSEGMHALLAIVGAIESSKIGNLPLNLVDLMSNKQKFAWA